FNWDDRDKLPRELSESTAEEAEGDLPPSVSLDGLTVPTAAPSGSKNAVSGGAPATAPGTTPVIPPPAPTSDTQTQPKAS
ncbi:MAG TPA: hypothetical protein VIY86_09860, partial [Pirellulaceae bacterium]